MHKGDSLFLLKKNKFLKIHILLLFCIFLWSSTTPYKHPNPTKDLSLIEATDHVIVVKNNTVIFEHLEQEEVKVPVQIRVIEAPKFGVVSLNEDNTFEYSPPPNLCGAIDQFTYHMTIEEKSFNVIVSIEILCESFLSLKEDQLF